MKDKVIVLVDPEAPLNERYTAMTTGKSRLVLDKQGRPCGDTRRSATGPSAEAAIAALTKNS